MSKASPVAIDDIARTLLNVIYTQAYNQENYMADYTKVNADLVALSAKLDALLAKQAAPVVDDQPTVDAIAAHVEALLAKIPA
jgi:hypothetical protein